MAVLEETEANIQPHRLVVGVQLKRNLPVGPAIRRQSRYRMCRVHT